MDPSLNPQTTASSQLPGPSVESRGYSAFTDAINTMDTAIGYYQALIDKQRELESIRNQIISKHLPLHNGLFLLNRLNANKQYLEVQAKKSLVNANLAIQAFNNSSLSQDPDINGQVSRKRLKLNQFFTKVRTEAQDVNAMLSQLVSTTRNGILIQQPQSGSVSSGPPHMRHQQLASQLGQTSSSSATSAAHTRDSNFITTEASSTTGTASLVMSNRN